MIKTTVDLDEVILEKAMNIYKDKTKKEIISIALSELVQRHEQKDLYELFESDACLIDENYDYKAMRRGSVHDIG